MVQRLLLNHEWAPYPDPASRLPGILETFKGTVAFRVLGIYSSILS